MARETDRLPTQIITNILSRLPVKSLFRNRSVSKPWRSIIDKPRFVKTHLYFSTQVEITDSSSLILLPTNYAGRFFIVEDENSSADQGDVLKASKINLSCSKGEVIMKRNCADDTDDEEEEDEYDEDEGPYAMLPYLVGYSHGLLCVSNTPHIVGEAYICNPATKKFVKLPNFPGLAYTSPDSFDFAVGFGFDRSSNDFKVVQVVGSSGKVVYVQIYTPSSQEWRKVVNHADLKKDFGLDLGLRGVSLVFVNGAFHWLTQIVNLASLAKQNRQSPLRIVSFDLKHENFGVVPNPPFSNLPRYPELVNYSAFALGVLGGCLCLSDCYYQDDCFDIWVLKKYNVVQSWTKQYVIRKPLVPSVFVGVVRPVFVRKNGEVVLLCNSGFLVSYNPNDRKATPLEDNQLPKCQNYRPSATKYYAFLYVASLISPESVFPYVDHTTMEDYL